ncbi:fimbrillin family protein [Bacteroides nordii]|uniref:fimbrillin family protein n=1 Tax=Bacteroides nordii TaxID=291645 RepID=UPI00203F7D2E|nr:fimbrillin family protein [Bacteroides nordii]
MKTFIFSALALGMMASCSNTEVEGIDVVDNGEPVAIQLSAGVQTNVVAGLSRAAITGADGVFVATVLGWEGSAADYSVAAKWNTTTNSISAQANGEAITLTKTEYYNSSKEVNTYMKAYYPEGTVTTGNYNFTTPLKDGTQDILVSTEVVGNRSNTTNKVFTFTHPLTQLNFSAIEGSGWGTGSVGSVKSITLKGVSVATGVKISDNSLVSESVDAGLAVTNIDAEAGIAVGKTDTPMGDPVMIVPTTKNEILVDVVMADGISFSNVKVTTTDDTFMAGKAYAITLTFNNKKVAGTATVTDWTTGGTGSGTVE